MKNKLATFSVLAIASLALCSCSFVAPSIETEDQVLTEAGYDTHIMTDAEISDPEEGSPLMYATGVVDCLYAKKESDEIYLIYFFSIEEASYNIDFLYTTLTTGQINELVYAGTSRAIKDAKL